MSTKTAYSSQAGIRHQCKRRPITLASSATRRNRPNTIKSVSSLKPCQDCSLPCTISLRKESRGRPPTHRDPFAIKMLRKADLTNLISCELEHIRTSCHLEACSLLKSSNERLKLCIRSKTQTPREVPKTAAQSHTGIASRSQAVNDPKFFHPSRRSIRRNPYLSRQEEVRRHGTSETRQQTPCSKRIVALDTRT